MIIDPDHFLETAAGRLWTPERNLQAWATAFAVLDAALAAAVSPADVIVVCGVQGSGKSTWTRTTAGERPAAILFDAALPGRRHRRPIIEAARQHGARVSAVWIDVPLVVALNRNAARSHDKAVPEASLRTVFERFEPPSREEGFDEIRIVRP
ncbi:MULTISPECIES: AAA family ATPase [Methylobacteriaceae]|uniref:AAA family ATPase n=1 Tax=Methylobacteriaceae TaxID=119045 RepID=UPI00074F8770|nr:MULTISPECIES: AAA family ATPase [Methylobacteriaceae]AMB48408.1 kinase [Methylobacterium sp. AMS5]TFZ54948.1 kinase [Methylorubrum sp. Q1]